MLEHCKHPWLAAINMESSLNKNGCLFVSVPFIWRYHNYPLDYWRFTHQAISILFPNIEWFFQIYITPEKSEIIFDEKTKSFEYKTLAYYKKETTKKMLPVTIVVCCGVRK